MTRLQLLPIVVAVLLGAGACSSGRVRHQGSSDPGYGPLRTQYESERFGERDYTNPALLICHETPSTEITELGLERTSCYGTCPEYTVIVSHDGSVQYEGRAFIKLGKHTAQIDRSVFRALAVLLESILATQSSELNRCLVTDSQSVYLSFVRGGKRIVLEHYAPELSGPPSLWAFEELFDALITGTVCR